MGIGHRTNSPRGSHASQRRGRAVATGLLLVAALTGCGDEGGQAAAPPAPATSQPGSTPTKPAGTKVTTGPQGGDAGKGLCGLFSTEEIADRLGLPVGAGETAGPLGSACQWSVDSDDGGFVQIQRVPADYWTMPSMSKSFKPLPGVGKEAYTDTGLPGEWTAGALHGKEATVVGMHNGKSSREAAAALLKETLSRG